MAGPDPYSVACPDCGKPANQPCVYLPQRNVDPDFAHYRSATVQYRAALTGTPTKRPHNGRLDAVYRLGVRHAEMARRRELLKQGRAAEASPLRRKIARIQVEYDRREYEQLRAWLAEFGGILTN